MIWAFLLMFKCANRNLKFERLEKVAKTVLILPHSNAGKESVFSMIKKNKNLCIPGASKE